MENAVTPQKSPIVDMYALSPMQAGLLFHSLLDEDSPPYFVQIKIALRGEVDASRMEQVYRLLIDNYDAFRISVVHENVKQPVQVVLRHREGKFAFHDLGGMDAAEQERCFDDSLQADRRLRFALDKDVLFRAMLFRFGEREHRLVFSFHHIIVDGWCINLLVDAAQRLYADLAAGRTPARLDAPPYKDYIRWVLSQDKEAARGFWSGYLAGHPGLAVVPKLDAPAEAGHTGPWPGGYVNQSLYFHIDAQRTSGLQALCRELGVTLNSVLQTVWGMALQRYNRSHDVVFGCVVSGRSDEVPRVESMVGLLINTLPLRVKTSGDTSFAEAVQQVQRDFRDCERYGHLPLADMQRCAGSAGELFDSLFVFQNLPEREAVDAGFTVEDIDEIEQTNYDFNLIFKVGRSIRITCAYNGARVSQDTARAAFTHLLALVDGILADPRRRVVDYEVVGEAERARLLVDFNRTAHALPAEDNVCSVFKDVVARVPDRLAVIDSDERLTYRQLDERANRLARHLRAQGVGAGDMVGLMPERSVDMVVSLLAVLKSGAAYVPLDPAVPRQRLEHIVADTGMRLLLTGRTAPADLPGVQVRRIRDIDLGTHAGHELDRTELAEPHAGAHPAYVIYTSGSTGLPKGVAISHRNVVNLNVCFQEDIGFRDERMTQFAPFTFDAAAGEIFVTLLGGSSLFIIPGEIQQEVERIQAFLVDNEISFASFPPDFFAYFDPERVGCLRRILTAGSRPNRETINKWLGRATYINAYGPTETTVLSTAWMSDRQATVEGYVSIGRPMCNTTCYVLDEHLRLVPLGTPGELCIGGEGVALGYVNQPALNAEKFVDNPYRPGERIYRTGDLVRQHADGSFEFLGRLDFQTKIRGHRVEPEEVERTLLGHPSLQEVAVQARVVNGVNSLCAYFTLKPEAPPVDGMGLRQHLAQSLPAYMIPSYYIRLDAMPLTPHFKVDRKALPDPVQAGGGPGDTADHEPPRNALEESLCALWSEVLGASRIGRADNFFTVGGDSIKAIQIVSRLRKMGHAIRVAQLMQAPTVAEIAALLGPAAQAAPTPDANEPAQAPAYTPMALVKDHLGPDAIDALARRARGADEELLVEDVLPLAPMQAGMLFHRLLDATSTAYVGQVHLVVEGHIDPKRLAKTCERLIERHEALRTAIVTDGVKRPVQVVFDKRAPACRFEDLRGAPDAAQAVRDALARDRERGFDLAHDTLLRMALLQEGENRQHLLISAHHIVLDGWSMGRIVDDFVAIYDALGRGRRPALPPARPYREYLWWLDQQRGEKEDAARAHWKAHLDGYTPRGTIPQLRTGAGTDAGGYRAEVFRGEVDASRSAALSALARRLGVTLNSVFQAIWTTVLQRYNQTRDVAFGCVVSGRGIELEGADEIVGIMIGSVPLRVTTAQGERFSQLAQSIHRRFVDNERYSHLGLPAIQECAGSKEALFDHLFVFENFPIDNLEADGFKVVSREVIDETNYDFNLVINPGDAVGIVVAYNASAIGAAAVARIVGHIDAVVSQVLRDADQAVDAIDILPSAQRQQLLVGFNQTAAPAAPDATLKALFEQQAARTPDATAAVFGGRSIRYGELDAQANRLAHFLVAQGAVPGTRVGVVADKSLETLAAILAVQKAGGVFVPIASSWPHKRVLDVVEQAGLPVMLHAGDALLSADEAAQCRLTGWRIDGLLAEGTVTGPDGSLHRLDAFASTHLPETRGADDVCYLMFTSGTTGKPKGIANTQRNFAHLAGELARHHYAPGRGVVQVAAWHFDASVMDLLGGLVHGATLYVTDASPRHIVALLVDEPVHELLISPSILREIVSMLTPEEAGRIRALEQITCGGEPLHYQLLRRARELMGERVRFTNIYGPTETTVFCTRHPVDKLDSTRTIVEIGRPIGNMKAYVLDEQLRPCPVGIVGEIYMSGPGVAQGYVDAPQATQAAFIASPFEAGAILYKTGDRACWNDEGVLEIMGRLDSQTKIRGYRVELSEVRSALLQHPGLEDAVVLTQDSPAGKILAAFIVHRHDGTPPVTEDALRRFLMTALPDYMVPASIVALDALPSTANHKVDLDKLRDMAVQLRAATRQSEPLSTPMQHWLAQRFQQVLGCEAVHADDNFFELGGNSLKGIDLISLVKAERGLPAEMSNLYVYPTLKDLAAYYEQLAPDAAPAARAVVSDAQRDAELAASLEAWLQGQGAKAPWKILRAHRDDGSTLVGLAVLDEAVALREGALFGHLRASVSIEALPHHVAVTNNRQDFEAQDFWRLFAGHASEQAVRQRIDAAIASFLSSKPLEHVVRRYPPSPRQQLALRKYGLMHLSQNNADMRIHHPCEPAVFEEILRRVVQRHAMLRTVVGVLPDGRFELRECADADCYSLTVLDLSDLPHEAQQREIKQFIRDVSRSFDLTRGPLHRAILIRENHKSCRWIWTFSHFISDGECGKLMATEFYKLFDAIVQGQPATLGEEQSSHAAYVEAVYGQRALPSREAHRAQMARWLAEARSAKQKMAAWRDATSLIRFKAYEVAMPAAAAGAGAPNPMDLAYTALVQAAAMWLDTDKVPVANLYHGRRYGKSTFFNQVGDYHDRIPLLVPVDPLDPRQTLKALLSIKTQAETDPPNHFLVAEELVDAGQALLEDVMDAPFFFNFSELVTYLSWNDGDRFQQMQKEHTLVPEGIYDGQCGLLMHRVASDRLLFSLVGHQLQAQPFARLAEGFVQQWHALTGEALKEHQADGLVM